MKKKKELSKDAPLKKKEGKHDKKVVRKDKMALKKANKKAKKIGNRVRASSQKTKKKERDKVALVMSEFKDKQLTSGTTDKIVTNPKQAIAIALSEARKLKTSR